MYKIFFKRVFDILIGIVALPLVFLVFVIFAPIIYFTDKGPIVYNSMRLGRFGKPFKMYKLRSMYVNSPDIRNEDGSTYNSDDDPRVTRIGRFLRKSSIDEIPQFLNVLIGNMSFIGPRPDPLDDMLIYTEAQKKKLDVKPGITGYNQAYYRNSVAQNEKFENDLYYVSNISFLLDLKILFKTFKMVICHENVYNDASIPECKSKEILEKMEHNS